MNNKNKNSINKTTAVPFKTATQILQITINEITVPQSLLNRLQSISQPSFINVTVF